MGVKKEMITKKHMIFLLLVGLVAMMAIGSVSAADTVKYVNGSVVTSGDGNTWSTAYKTIREGINNVANGGTVNIAPGTYTGTGNKDITVNKNVTIKGAGENNTIIDPKRKGRAFNITPGNNVTIQDLTIKNGNANEGGAILNKGNLTVKRVTFKNNKARRGGAIANLGNATITGSTFKNNYARLGGAIYNTGIGSKLSIKYSRILDNSPKDIYVDSGTVDARYNWWGTNFSRTNPLFAGRIAKNRYNSPVVYYDPWLILRIKADPNSIYTGGSSTITADLYTDSAGGNHKANSTLYPPEIPVRFTTDLGSIGSHIENTVLKYGIASVTLSAGHQTGIAHITARVDNQLVRLGVTIRRTRDPWRGHSLYRCCDINGAAGGNEGRELCRNIHWRFNNNNWRHTLNHRRFNNIRWRFNNNQRFTTRL